MSQKFANLFSNKSRLAAKSVVTIVYTLAIPMTRPPNNSVPVRLHHSFNLAMGNFDRDL